MTSILSTLKETQRIYKSGAAEGRPRAAAEQGQVRALPLQLGPQARAGGGAHAAGEPCG